MKALIGYRFEMNRSNSPRYGTIGYGEDNDRILESFNAFISHYSFPVSRLEEIESLKFYTLASEWKKETASFSSITKKAMNQNYQRIIGMGEQALPFIFQELERHPDHWFWALTAITGINAIRPENRGRLEQMADDWLNWGKENGYEWQPMA